MFAESKAPEFPTDPTIVVGVVHPRGSAGVQFKGKGWTLKFAFETWRGEDNILRENKLAITRQVTEEELRSYRKRIQPYAILSARLVFTGTSSAELIELLDENIDTDLALSQRATELLKPKTYEHERFGTFTLDRRVDKYEATTTWMDRTIELCLSATEEPDIQAVLQVAVEMWDKQTTWNQRISQFVVQDLLNIKNESWLEKGESELTPDEFISRMSLESIEVRPDKKFWFWYDDGDLFWGHAIGVRGNLLDGPTEAGIHG